MARPSFGNWVGMLIIGVFFAGAVVLSTHLATRTVERVKSREQSLRVKGTAERIVESDMATWQGSFENRAPVMTEAYAGLDQSRGKLLAFLSGAGFATDKVWLGPVMINKVMECDKEGRATNKIEAYRLSQGFSISGHGPEVEKVANVARDAGRLIAQGVELDAGSASYLYTKLPEMKMQMLSDAAANAYERARLLADPSGTKIGPMRSASQGVFQVTPVHSNEVSDEGLSDTGSKTKRVRAVVTVEYALE